MDFNNLKIGPSDRLSDRINHLLRLAIFEGELKPGDKLPSEERIARDLKVSKVSVREALRQMEAEGLIEKRRGIHGGSFVAEPNHAKIGELILTYIRWEAITPEHLAEFRILLEPSLAALAARNRTEEDLAAIRENIEKYQSQFEAGRLDASLGLEFHRLLAEACHNPMISAVMAAVAQVFVEIIARIPMTAEDNRIDLEYCLRLYDCLVDQRPEEARSLMVDHFQVLLEILGRVRGRPAVSLPGTGEEPGSGSGNQ